MAERKKVSGIRTKNHLIDKGEHYVIVCKVAGKDEYLEVLIDEKGLEKIKEINTTWIINSVGKYKKLPYIYGCYQGKRISLHRFLMDSKQGEIVDHINRNSLDNRYGNLRIVNAQDNAKNRSAFGMSGVKNVYWDKRSRKWQVLMKIDDRMKSFGLYKDIDEAEKVAIKSRLERGYLD